jgi:hypothetical protein
MGLAPGTPIPNMYRYGFLTSRAVGLLSQAGRRELSEEDRAVLNECRELVEKVIRGKNFLMGPSPNEVRNLRPDDVEAFTYVLENDRQVKDLASDQKRLEAYLQGIVGTFDSLAKNPAGQVPESQLKATVDFLSQITASLVESARSKLRTAPRERSLAAHP